jgi:hypothetical protein
LVRSGGQEAGAKDLKAGDRKNKGQPMKSSRKKTKSKNI